VTPSPGGTPPSGPVIAVVGAGIAGLAAAWELVTGQGTSGPAPRVHIFEAGGRVGGRMAATEFAGRRVDVAADAFLARRPEATDLCAELGLTDSLVPVGASGASIFARGRLRMMPDGLNLGVPTRWGPMARSGILTLGESLRVGKDLIVPHRRSGTAWGDRAVGAIVGERLGRPVVERLVDPLVGGINAGGVDDLSAAAAFPLLLAAASQPGSLMRRLAHSRSASASTGTEPLPAFFSLAGTTASLPEVLADALEARGVTIHTRTAVEAMEQTGGPNPAWRLSLGGPSAGSGPGSGSGSGSGGTPAFDGVVLATPAGRSALLVLPFAPTAGGLLHSIAYASVSVITLAVPEDQISDPMRGTGFLVPRTTIFDRGPALTTGVTFLGKKWPHLASPGTVLLRASVGRFGDERHSELDDDELTSAVAGELNRLLGLRGKPMERLVTRWPKALPQFEVGHLLRVRAIEQELDVMGAVALAGASLGGVGIPACIGSGRKAARTVLAALAPAPKEGAGTSGPP